MSRAQTRSQDPKIGGPLSQLLSERFMTQEELAAQIGVGSLTVSRWVRNKHSPFRKHVREIAEVFGVEPASLIDTEARGNGNRKRRR